MPKLKLTASQRDIETLKRSERVSIFWITETQRRAKLIDSLEVSGEFTFDNACGYPWLMVTHNAK